MSTGFEKFIKPEMKGSKKKEAIRQQKRKIKAESRAAGEEARRIKWEKQHGVVREEEPKFQDKRFKEQDSRNKPQDARNKAQDTRSKPQDARKPVTKNLPLATANIQTETTNYTPPTGKQQTDDVLMPLNKFLAHSGVCGRREAAGLIKSGFVTVNGDTIFEPGYKVRGNEDVKFKSKKIFLQRNLVYILINKPKDYITTAKDPEGRRTILDLIKGATPERVYPVGRLDRNTTGVLLMTNDGELAQKLTHPSFQIKKIYEVKLDKPVAKKDFDAILEGLTLEDGFIKADSLGYVDAKDKTTVGIEIHSGRNRIVRRMFEHLGYDVRNLDRVLFANLTKKNVDRGKWRFLNEKEVRLLKFMNQSFIKKIKSPIKVD